MLLAVAQRPADLGRVGLGPPAVQLREVEAAVDQHLHAARAAGLPGPPRRVDPDVHPLHQVLGQEHVVVAEEDDMRRDLGPPDEVGPSLDQGLPGLVGRVGLAGEDQLHRALAGWSAGAAAAPDRAAAGSAACRSRSGARSPASARRDRSSCCAAVDRPPARRPRRPAAGPAARARSRRAPARRRCASCQSPASDTRRMSCSSVSVVPSQRSFPHASVQSSSASAESQLGMWTPLVTCPTGHFGLGPAREERLEEAPAHLAVQAADAVDRAAAADGQVGHVERLRRVVRVPAAEGQQIVRARCRAASRRTRRGTAR